MIADDIAAPNRVHPDLRRRTLAGQAFTAVHNILRVVELARLAKDLGQLPGRAARCVFLQTMMRLDDFEIEIRAQHPGSLSRQPEKRVDSNAEIRGENDWQRLCCLFNQRPLLLGVACRTDHQRLSGLEARSANIGGGTGMTEIDNDIVAADLRTQVIALI